MITLDQTELLNRFLEKSLGHPADRIEKLAGDASTRSYYRIFGYPESYIIMETGHAINASSDSFFSIQRLLKGIRIPVPEIIEWNAGAGLVLLEDLGDETLQMRVNRDICSVAGLYPRAIELILKMQHDIRTHIDPSCPAFHRFFDTEKFMEEFGFFNRNYLEAYAGCDLESSSIRSLNDYFNGISEFLSAQPQIFVHRDYHSRNLMVLRGDLVVIDFQDARLGLPEYDLASLLRDAYVVLNESDIAKYLDHFHRESIRKTQPFDVFRRCFFLTCVQRNIKALGKFGYQATTRRNPTYIPYMETLYAHLNKLAAEPEIADYREMFEILKENIAGIG